MKKFNIGKIYESSNSPTDTSVIWADKDETTGKLRALHKYDKATRQWKPDMVSVEYMLPDEELDKETVILDSKSSDVHVAFIEYLVTTDFSMNYVVIYSDRWTNSTSSSCLLEAPNLDSGGPSFTDSFNVVENPRYADGTVLDIKSIMVGLKWHPANRGWPLYFIVASKSQYEALRAVSIDISPDRYEKISFLIVGEKKQQSEIRIE